MYSGVSWGKGVEVGMKESVCLRMGRSIVSQKTIAVLRNVE